MNSSTSHSDRRIPVEALTLLAVAVAAWAACAFYSLRLNPEVIHYAYGARIKNDWSAKMTREHGAKTLVFGGSGCEFAIDGERMLARHGLPTVNLGRHAGMGAAVLAESVLEHARRGDTLIVAIEPGLLTRSLEQTPLGVQFSFAVHHPEWATNPTLGVNRVTWFEAMNGLRPGGYHVFTLLGKLARGAPLYRYQADDYRPSGWKQTEVHVPIAPGGGHSVTLSSESRELLAQLRAWCDRNGVRAAYSLPWAFSPPEARRDNARFLLQVGEFFPVLKDPLLGVHPEPKLFSDTPLHLNEAGAALRSDELAGQIREWRLWSAEELKALAAE